MTNIHKFIKTNKCRKIGSFYNSNGEQFLIYDYDFMPHEFFITGDEIDWETGYLLDRGFEMAFKDFGLSLEETQLTKQEIIKHLCE